jgi:hypothetical protein
MTHLPRIIAACAAALFACHAGAADLGATGLALDGFGTLGVLHSSYDQADFVTANPFYRDGVGYTRSWAADQDSKLGLQVTASLGDRVTAVIQGISQRQYDDTFRPELEWANLQFAITPELSVRVGRIVLPTFLSSDTENVGYVRPWVRTPGEIRVQLPMTNSDGVDVAYHFNIGDASHRLQVLYGNTRSTLPDHEVWKNRDIKAVTDTIEYGHLTLHAGYQKMHYRIAPNPVVSDFQAFDLGASYDTESWYVIAEQFSTYDGGVGNVRASSLGGGYHIASLTPYLVWSKVRQYSVGTFEAAPVFNQQTVAAGLRWDFMRNVDLKLQYERVSIDSPVVPASFINLQPGMQVGDNAHVLSATVDFVW